MSSPQDRDQHPDDARTTALADRLTAMAERQPVRATMLDLDEVLDDQTTAPAVDGTSGLRRWLVPAVAVAALVAAAIGVATLLPPPPEADPVGDTGTVQRSLGTGADFSVVGSLGAVPAAAAGDEAAVTTTDLDTVTELANATTPTELSPEAVAAWQQQIGDRTNPPFGPQGLLDETAPPGLTTVRTPASFGLPRVTRIQEFHDEVGWSILDAASFVAVEGRIGDDGDWLAPGPFTTALTRQPLDLPGGEAELRLGSGDGLVADLSATTPARPNGAALTVDADDAGVMTAADPDAADAWTRRDGASLAGDESLAAVAGALDQADVVSARLHRRSIGVVGIDGVDDGLNATAGPAFGVGWSMVEGQPRVHLAQHLGDPETAMERLDAIRAFWSSPGQHVASLRDQLDVADASVVGPVVLVSFTLDPNADGVPTTSDGEPRLTGPVATFDGRIDSRLAPFGTDTGPVARSDLDFPEPDDVAVPDAAEGLQGGSAWPAPPIGQVSFTDAPDGAGPGRVEVTMVCTGGWLMEVSLPDNPNVRIDPVACDGTRATANVELTEPTGDLVFTKLADGPGSQEGYFAGLQ